jgi:hypothetical protein
LIIFQPDNNIVNIKGKQEKHSLGHAYEKALWHRRVHSFRLLLLPNFSEYMPETISKDCWHLVEGIGTAIWVLSQWIRQWHWIENAKKYISYFLNWFFSCFCLPNQFFYTHRHYFNSFGNVSVFYPNLLIICISYLLGLSRRQFNLGMLFIQNSKCCPLP